MTNAEKFKDVFGFNPDIETLIYDCPNSISEKCKYHDDLGGCHCELWWKDEYVKEKKNEYNHSFHNSNIHSRNDCGNDNLTDLHN